MVNFKKFTTIKNFSTTVNFFKMKKKCLCKHTIRNFKKTDLIPNILNTFILLKKNYKEKTSIKKNAPQTKMQHHTHRPPNKLVKYI